MAEGPTAQLWGSLQRTDLTTFTSTVQVTTPNMTITKSSYARMVMSPPVFYGGLIYLFWGYHDPNSASADSMNVTVVMPRTLKVLLTRDIGGSVTRFYYTTHQATGLAFFGSPQGSFQPPGSVTPMWCAVRCGLRSQTTR